MKQVTNFNIKIILVDLGENEKMQKDIKNKFGTKYKLSVGIDILKKKINLGDGIDGNLLIWNLSGENIFQLIKDLFRKEYGIAFIVFNLTKLKTSEQMNRYLSMIRQFNLDKYPYVLIGNKSSYLKKDGLYIYSNDVKKFAESEGCIFLEVSSETNSEVDKAFNQLTKKILNSKVQI